MFKPPTLPAAGRCCRSIPILIKSAICVSVLILPLILFTLNSRGHLRIPLTAQKNLSEPVELGNGDGQATSRKMVQFDNLVPLVLPANATGAIAETAFFQSISKLEIECPNSTRLGNAADGGWQVCQYGSYQFKQPCLVYSFGINNEWSFDDAVVAMYNCTVRSFDPSMSLVENHRRGSNIWFYKKGIAGSNGVSPLHWQMRTLSSITKELNDADRTIDYLKMDVEYSEWESLQTALVDGSLAKVKQLALEIHTREIEQKSSSLADFQLYTRVLHGLHVAGFRRWYWHHNPWSITAVSVHTGAAVSCCSEMVFVNLNFQSGC